MDQLEFHDIRKDFDAIQSEPLAPYVTHSWISDRLSQAPSPKRIRAYFDRKRPSELSETARRELLSCGRWHERALRILHEGVASQADIGLVIRRASKCMSSALGDFYRIQYDDDLNHCLTDFESLMMTACFFLSMYTSRAEWAARCSKVLKNNRLRINSRIIKRIPVKEDLEDSETVLNMFFSSYQEALEKMERKERSARENSKKGKERRTRRGVRKEPLEVITMEYDNSAMLFQPPFPQNQAIIHSGHNFPVASDVTQTFWPGPRVPSLGYDFSSPLVDYCGNPSSAYTASVYEYPTASPAPQQTTTPSMVNWLHTAPKRHLSKEDDLEFQRPSQRQKHGSSASSQAQTQPFTYNDAASLPLMASNLPPSLDLPASTELYKASSTEHYKTSSTEHYKISSTGQYKASGTEQHKVSMAPTDQDFIIWDEGEELVDLTPCDGFNASDFQSSFFHLLSRYQDLGIM